MGQRRVGRSLPVAGLSLELPATAVPSGGIFADARWTYRDRPYLSVLLQLEAKTACGKNRWDSKLKTYCRWQKMAKNGSLGVTIVWKWAIESWWNGHALVTESDGESEACMPKQPAGRHNKRYLHFTFISFRWTKSSHRADLQRSCLYTSLWTAPKQAHFCHIDSICLRGRPWI